MTSCGPRSGISDESNEPAVCGVKDYTLADTNKIVPRTATEINGFNLFKLHCRQCHAPPDINPENGVGLRGLFYRLPNENYFKIYLQNSDSLRKSGDPYANKLKSEFNSDFVHDFKQSFTVKEINDIAEYIKLESKSIN